MARVTAIKPQKNRKRVNIYLDGKFSSRGRPASGWGFGIDLDSFVKSGLKEGQELTEREIEEIVKKSEYQKTLDKLLKFATLRPRSEKEIDDWFKRKKVYEGLQKDLFIRLRHLDLVDDRKFAQWWVEQRQEFSPRAKRIINYELRMKGVDEKIIEEVLSKTEIDEEKIAKELLKKKKYKWKGVNKYEARQKMSEFLARKGFNWEVIDKILKGDLV